MASEWNLPHDIIVQILSTLPVKSLLQFRCVCKSWCYLISDSHFVKTHLSCMSGTDEDDDYKHYKVIFNSPGPNPGFKFCSLYSVLYEPSLAASDPDYPLHLKDSTYWAQIMASCNGLLCIRIEAHLFIWNPSIRKSKRLPDSGIGGGVYGFGYDESIDDYKVVGVSSVVGNGASYEAKVKVYTLRTDTWRSIQDFPCGKPPLGDAKFVSKALHWPVNVGTKSKFSWVIVSLDLAKETYKVVAQPKYGNGVCRDDFFSDPLYRYGDFNLTLGILRGCQCELCNYHLIQADVCVMKEYGVKDSWTRVVTIPPYGRGLTVSVFLKVLQQYSVPLCISKNGEILLEFGSLVIYDLKERTFRYPSISFFQPSSYSFCASLYAKTYFESLVSPSADNELQEYH